MTRGRALNAETVWRTGGSGGLEEGPRGTRLIAANVFVCVIRNLFVIPLSNTRHYLNDLNMDSDKARENPTFL